MRNFDITLIWIAFFAAVFLAWYFYLKARNKERMALIESGKDVTEIYSKQEIKFRFPWLRIGLLFTGIGFGLVVALVFVSIPQISNVAKQFDEVLPISLMVLFGGFGIVLGHYLDKPKN